VVKTGHFTPGKDPTPTVEEAEWALKQVWSQHRKSQGHWDLIPKSSNVWEAATLKTLPWLPGFKYIYPSAKLKFVLKS